MKFWILAALLLYPAMPQALQGKAERHYRLAMALADRGRFLDAARELDVAIALEPDSELVLRAREAVRQGKAPMKETFALRRFEDKETKATGYSLAQKKAAAAAKAGQEFYLQSKLAEAAESWRRALVLAPDNDQAQRGLARLALEKYKFDSDQPFDQTISEMYNLALREMRKERYVEARAKLEEALKLNPTQYQVKRMLAQLETAALVQQGERSAETMCNDGDAMLREGSLAQARLAYDRALELDPSMSRAKQGLARQKRLAGPQVALLIKKAKKAVKQGKAGEAEAWYAQVLDLDPGHQLARKGMALSARGVKEKLVAADRRKKATRWYNLGVNAWEAGRLADAAEAFKKVVKINPADKDAQLALQKVQARMDAQVGEDARKAGRLFHQGKELEKRGQLEEAWALFNKALVRDPSHADAKQAALRLEGELKK